MSLSHCSTGDAELDSLVDDWLRWSVPGSEAVREVTGLLEAKDYQSLGKIMRKRLVFGTAGIRGAMGTG